MTFTHSHQVFLILNFLNTIGIEYKNVLIQLGQTNFGRNVALISMMQNYNIRQYTISLIIMYMNVYVLLLLLLPLPTCFSSKLFVIKVERHL